MSDVDDPQQQPSPLSLLAPATLLQQVLSGVNELRGRFTGVEQRVDEIQRDQHAMRAEMATKDDLKQYTRIEVVDGMRSANDTRFNDLSSRQTRTEDRYDKLRDDLHVRDVTEAHREHDTSISHEVRNAEDRFGLDSRTINILMAVVGLMLSPLIWALVNLLQHVITHP